MLKTLPKSNISKRAFPVYKQWEVTNADYPLISASLESGSFDTDSANYQNGVYTYPLYRSIQSKFYNTGSADVLNTFGRYNNLAYLDTEREFSNDIWVLKLPQSKYGEEIKPGSVLFQYDSIEYRDNSNGSIVSSIPRYTISELDVETGDMTIVDNDGETFTGTITSFDIETGIMVATFNGDTDTFEVVNIDIENGLLETAVPLDFDGLSMDELSFGNIFYDEGLLVFRQEVGPSYTMTFRSTKTIYETEILVSARAGEFNYSQNPTAVDVVLSDSYDFETTEIKNSTPAGTKKIKEVLDISRREYYTGSIGTSTGSWDDYFEYASTDRTGSYLAPYITTIGLYDNNGDMVAIAKLPQPIKNLPDYDMNFIVRFDT